MKKIFLQDMRVKLKWQMVDLSYVLISILLAFIVGGIFLVILGCNPIEAYGIILKKPFTSFDTVLRRATIYILSGLAVAIPVKTGVFNMGGEGQVAAGALAAAVIGSAFALPMGIHPIVCLLGAAVIGASLSSISAFMKLKFGASEVVTGIMINYVVMYLLSYLSMYTFRGSANSAQTAEIFETAKLARGGEGVQWSYGLFIAIGMCILFAFIMNRTRFGLELKSAGFSPLASKYQGVNVKAMAFLSMAIGGAMAGLGGGVEVLGGRYLYLDTYFANYGYDGIAVAYMARNNPIAIVITALLVSALKVGAVALDRQAGVSIYFAIALQGMIITLLVSPYLVQSVFEKIKKVRLTRKENRENALAA
jgi:simple sugar transport system permease protein